MAAPVDSLDPIAYLEALAAAARVLEDHAVALDLLDHPGGLDSPGADEATRASPPPGVGSDLAATLSSAVSEAEGAVDFASISSALERGAAKGCSGAAGRGLKRLLRGMGEVLRNVDRLDATRFALALEAGAELLAPSDDGRHPGGFTTVLGVVADAALSNSDRGAELGETILAAAGAGIEELERGPEVDPRLAASGTVDAAAAGLLLVLDTLASVVTGEPLPARPVSAEAPQREVADIVVLYDVKCRLIPDDPGIEAATHLEALLVQMADVRTWQVSGDAWEVALRTPSPGTAVEALVEVGRPRELHIGLAGGGSGPGSSREATTGSLLGTVG